MPERKPSWLCRACQDKFHTVCLDPGSCILDNGQSYFQEEYPNNSRRFHDVNKQENALQENIHTLRQ